MIKRWIELIGFRGLTRWQDKLSVKRYCPLISTVLANHLDFQRSLKSSERPMIVQLKNFNELLRLEID